MEHNIRCELTDETGADCMAASLAGAPVAICLRHAAEVYQFVCDTKVTRMKRPAKSGPSTAAVPERLACVYYIRFGERVKIGTTTDLISRMRTIPHDEILAIEPGGHALEHMRHLEFAAWRDKGEWFDPAPEIRAHVESIRLAHGSPLVAWRRWQKTLRHAA